MSKGDNNNPERRQYDEIFDHKLDSILKYNKQQDKMISEMHEIIHGNGDPSKGMIVQVTKMEITIRHILDTLKTHWKIIIAILFLIAGIALRIFAF